MCDIKTIFWTLLIVLEILAATISATVVCYFSEPERVFCVIVLILIIYIIDKKTWSSPRFPLRSHSLVCIKNHLFIV